MVQDNLQKHLDHAMYGNSLVNPKEQQYYLGTFRERCYFVMTIAQMNSLDNKGHFENELDSHPEAYILLSGALDTTIQSDYIKLITQKKRSFTIINDFVSNTPTSLGLVLASKTAINESKITIEEKYPATVLPSSDKSAKKGFWHKLFH